MITQLAVEADALMAAPLIKADNGMRTPLMCSPDRYHLSSAHWPHSFINLALGWHSGSTWPTCTHCLTPSSIPLQYMTCTLQVWAGQYESMGWWRDSIIICCRHSINIYRTLTASLSSLAPSDKKWFGTVWRLCISMTQVFVMYAYTLPVCCQRSTMMSSHLSTDTHNTYSRIKMRKCKKKKCQKKNFLEALFSSTPGIYVRAESLPFWGKKRVSRPLTLMIHPSLHRAWAQPAFSLTQKTASSNPLSPAILFWRNLHLFLHPMLNVAHIRYEYAYIQMEGIAVWMGGWWREGVDADAERNRKMQRWVSGWNTFEVKIEHRNTF